MPGFFPTQIAQVHDFTVGPGSRLVEATGNTGINPTDVFNLIDKTFGAYTRAQQSEDLARAIDAATRGMESGLTWTEAVSGLDPRVTGRKAFQDALQGTRTSIIEDDTNERAWAEYQLNAAREAREAANAQRLLESDALYANFLKFMRDTKTNDAGAWIDMNKAALERNPLAYTKIMEAVGTAGYDTLTPDTEAPTPLSREQIEEQINIARKNMDQYGQLGLMDSLAKYKEKKTTFDSFVNDYAKQTGDTGGDYSDLRHNMQRGYNQLKPIAEKLGLPEEAVFWAMERNVDPAFWWFTQDSIDTSAAADLLRTSAPIYHNNYQNYERNKATYDFLKNIRDNNIDLAAQRQYDTVKRQLDAVYKAGRITKNTYDRLISNANARYGKDIASTLEQLDIALANR